LVVLLPWLASKLVRLTMVLLAVMLAAAAAAAVMVGVVLLLVARATTAPDLGSVKPLAVLHRGAPVTMTATIVVVPTMRAMVSGTALAITLEIAMVAVVVVVVVVAWLPGLAIASNSVHAMMTVTVMPNSLAEATTEATVATLCRPGSNRRPKALTKPATTVTTVVATVAWADMAFLAWLRGWVPVWARWVLLLDLVHRLVSAVAATVAMGIPMLHHHHRRRRRARRLLRPRAISRRLLRLLPCEMVSDFCVACPRASAYMVE